MLESIGVESNHYESLHAELIVQRDAQWHCNIVRILLQQKGFKEEISRFKKFSKSRTNNLFRNFLVQKVAKFQNYSGLSSFKLIALL